MSRLAVEDLRVFAPSGLVVDRLTVYVERGRVVALVGEPGSGAVEAGSALLDLEAGDAMSGTVRIGDDDLLVLAPPQRRRVRGARIGALYPDPRQAFDTELTLADNLLEIAVHGARLPPDEATTSLRTALEDAGVADADEVLLWPAGQLPVGLLQRACVALARVCGTQIVIANDPTAVLDPLDAADVRDLVRSLAVEEGIGVLYVTEDLSDAAVVADEIAVVHAGEVHEQGPVDALLGGGARGPCTRAALAFTPRLDRRPRRRASTGRALQADAAGPGCRWADRCPFVEPLCRSQHPDLRPADASLVRCHFADEVSWADRLDAYYGSQVAS